MIAPATTPDAGHQVLELLLELVSSASVAAAGSPRPAQRRRPVGSRAPAAQDFVEPTCSSGKLRSTSRQDGNLVLVPSASVLLHADAVRSRRTSLSNRSSSPHLATTAGDPVWRDKDLVLLRFCQAGRLVPPARGGTGQPRP